MSLTTFILAFLLFIALPLTCSLGTGKKDAVKELPPERAILSEEKTEEQRMQRVKDLEVFRMGVYEEVNRKREEYGLEAWTIVIYLHRSAQSKADKLTELKYFGHTLPDKTPFFKFIEDQSYYREYYAENLATGFPTPQATVNAWMDSPPHKSVLLSKSSDSFGIGVSYFRIDPNKSAGILAVLHSGGGKYEFKPSLMRVSVPSGSLQEPVNGAKDTNNDKNECACP